MGPYMQSFFVKDWFTATIQNYSATFWTFACIFLCLGLGFVLNFTSLVSLMLQCCHECCLSVTSTIWIMLECQTGCGKQSIDNAINKLLSWHSLVAFITTRHKEEETATVALSALLVLGLSLFSWWVWMALIVSLLTDVTIIWLPV